MIPILAIPVLNRGDFLMRCIRSIDYPVDKIVVINNGKDRGVAATLEQLLHSRMYPLQIVESGYNRGVAASWNWVMRKFPKAEYWLHVGSDIKFSKGDLEKMDRFIRDHLDYATMPANWGHSLFAITRAGIEGVGYFDESIWPAYTEDQDWMYRLQLSGMPWQDVPEIKAVHGEPPLWGSSTVWSDPELNRRCAITQKNNHEFYRRKWGGDPGKEVFKHPFDDPSLSIKDCPVDEDLLQANGHPMYTKEA